MSYIVAFQPHGNLLLTNQASPFYIHSKPLIVRASVNFLRHGMLIPSSSKANSSPPSLPPPSLRLMLLIISLLLSIVAWHPNSLPTLPQS